MIHREIVHRETEPGRHTSVLVDNGRRPPYLRNSTDTRAGQKYWTIVTTVTRPDGVQFIDETRFRSRDHAERWMSATLVIWSQS